MWLKPYGEEICYNRQLKQTAKNSVAIEIDAYSLPFTLVNGLLQLDFIGVLTPSSQSKNDSCFICSINL